ncbi:beta-galactosidase [Pseudonocardia kunmingensis]|uniref:Beta-galactosidase n=1 Tax=Pseudonocardia kunmingensis TaxID=630975 RepID=A0A543DJ41_9PSEU|nr:beta-galactosidase [Pseudonocardia kunmingensis]TQM09356.1 beta-galactosidase [Pseudonocardia kunmingensis]
MPARRKAFEFPFPGIAMGCDYNPEQWDPDVWREDVALMREAGLGFVTLGVFSWALLEPAEDEYDFAWFDEVLGLLHEGGIAVDLATATASPPPWLTRSYPEVLPVDVEGRTLWPGSRQSWCPSSPVFREHALQLVGELARRYGSHPAVRMWHVSNELGCHIVRCYCDESAAAFRRWLAGRYGTLEALNEAWGTAFWSQHYSSFDEVLPPRLTPSFSNPGHELDFSRFSSDALLDYYRAERDVLRTLTPDLPVTTNLMVNARQPGPDYFRWAPELDLIAQDHYLDARMPHPHAEQAFSDDFTRGVAGGAPWMLMESATSAVNWQPVNVAKKPGELLLDSLRHVARGADTVGFFQWRASKAGAEKYHSALVPHAGPDSARFREVAALGEALGKLGEVAGSRVEADVALLVDWEAWWACDQTAHPSCQIRYMDAALRWHRAVTELGATADVVHPCADLSGYRLVVVPTLYLCADATAEAVQAYVRGGGHVLVTYFSGIVDEHDHVRLGGYPGAFRELLGVRTEEFAPLRPGETVALDDGSAADVWTELLEARDAEVVARYTDGPLPGTPALTRRAVGDGVAWYLATWLDDDATAALAGRLAREAGVTRLDAPQPGLEVVRRGRYLFVLNRGGLPATVPARGTDLLTGDAVDGAIEVAAGGAAVVRTAD